MKNHIQQIYIFILIVLFCSLVYLGSSKYKERNNQIRTKNDPLNIINENQEREIIGELNDDIIRNINSIQWLDRNTKIKRCYNYCHNNDNLTYLECSNRCISNDPFY